MAVGEAGGRAARLDRHASGSVSDPELRAAARRSASTGDGEVLSATRREQEASATRLVEGEVALHELWFALPPQQRLRFGEHFSEMLLRAVHRQNDSTSSS